jgi:hypothetical protein
VHPCHARGSSSRLLYIDRQLRAQIHASTIDRPTRRQLPRRISKSRRSRVRRVPRSARTRQEARHRGRDPDLVRVLAIICPGLMALGAPMHHPAAPTGSPYTRRGPNGSRQLRTKQVKAVNPPAPNPPFQCPWKYRRTAPHRPPARTQD